MRGRLSSSIAYIKRVKPYLFQVRSVMNKQANTSCWVWWAGDPVRADRLGSVEGVCLVGW
jgi:hypothetical protein